MEGLLLLLLLLPPEIKLSNFETSIEFEFPPITEEEEEEKFPVVDETPTPVPSLKNFEVVVVPASLLEFSTVAVATAAVTILLLFDEVVVVVVFVAEKNDKTLRSSPLLLSSSSSLLLPFNFLMIEPVQTVVLLAPPFCPFPLKEI